MPTPDPQPSNNPEKKKPEAPSSTIRSVLEELKETVPEKPSVMGLIQSIKNYFGTLDSTKKKQIATIVGTAIFGLLFAGSKEGAEKNEEATEDQEVVVEDEDGEENEEEGVEDEEELVSRPKRKKVVCDDARLICINTDPAGNKRPSYLQGKSSYLCEYGLPNYDTFKEEMIGFLAPDAESEKDGMKKVMDVLQRSPMGKYQCMPQYVFQYVEEFKDFNFDWLKERKNEQLDEKLNAMWTFLQDEDMQRRACTGYVEDTIAGLKAYEINGIKVFNGDPAYVFASYYGGLSAGKALLARDTNTATAKQKKRVSKKQGVYISIAKYAGKELTEDEIKKRQDGKMIKLDPVPPLSVAAIVSRIADKESHNLEGVKSKPRNEKWEQDERFAYNRTDQTDNENMLA